MILLQQSIRQSSLEMVEGEAIRKILFTRYPQRKFGLSNLKKDERTFHHSNSIEFTSSNKQIFENIVTNIANSSQMLGVGTSTPRKQSIHRSSILFFSFCQNFNERNVSSFYEFTLSNKLLANISTDVMAISRFLSQCKCFLCVRIVPQHPCQRVFRRR